MTSNTKTPFFSNLMSLSVRPNVINKFTLVIYECLLQVTIFVPARPFQPCDVCENRLDRSNKDKHASLLRAFINYTFIQFYNIGPRGQCNTLFTAEIYEFS